MIPKNEKQDLDKYDIYLSEQLSRLFPDVEDDDVVCILVKKIIKK